MTSQLRKIVCPVDFSPGAREAMQRAVGLAIQNRASLVLVHVSEPVLWAAGTELPFSGDAVQEMIDGEQRSLDAAADEARSLGAPTIIVETLTGGAADAIVDLARRDPDIDLIVMGTHGRTGLQHALLGSVAEKVVRTAPCDVLVTRKRA